MTIVEFDGPPSWSLDSSETRESIKCPLVRVRVRVRVVGLIPTRGHFVLSPVLFYSRYQNGGPSNSTIDIYDLTGK